MESLVVNDLHEPGPYLPASRYRKYTYRDIVDVPIHLQYKHVWDHRLYYCIIDGNGNLYK